MTVANAESSATTTTAAWYPPETNVVTGPILAASDGTIFGEAAFKAAIMMAEKAGVGIQAVRVVEPLPVLLPVPSTVFQPFVVSAALMDSVREQTADQLSQLAAQNLKWSVEVEYGRPSEAIVKVARSSGAQMIVIGHSHHGVMDRILDGDTSLEVIRQSPAPVLLASAALTELPRRALFAVDFSAQSMAAARAAMRIVDDEATIVLAHAMPTAMIYDASGLWEEEYEKGAMRELRRFAAALRLPETVKIEYVLKRGRAARVLLDIASNVNADLIVAGTRGAGLMQRLLVGSVATSLVHHSHCSTLIVPDRPE